MQRVDPDEIHFQLVHRDSSDPETRRHDLEREACAIVGPLTRIGDLSFTDETVTMHERDLQRLRPVRA